MSEKICKIMVLLLGTAVLFGHSLLMPQDYDWDLDAFLYLGSRLDQGELIYFNDFETKLPLVQYLFWIANRFGGIGTWRVLTLVHAVVLGGIATHFLVNSLTAAHTARKISRQNLFWLTYSAYLILLYSLPGSSSAQLSMFAATHVFAATAFWSHAARKPDHSGTLVALSAASLALAVSIRPNYAFAVPAFAIFGMAPLIRSFSLTSALQALKPLVLFGTVCLIVFCAQFIPYAFAPGGQKILVQALAAIAAFSSAGINFLDLFRSEIFNETAGFYVFLYIGMAAVYLRARSNGGRLPAEIHVCLFTIVGLNLSFLRTHYYSHYAIMFVPFATVLYSHVILTCFQAQASAGKEPNGQTKHAAAIGVFLLLSLAAAPAIKTAFALYDFARHSNQVDMAIDNRRIDKELVEFLKDIKLIGLSFYTPSETAYHQLFGEERIGDGHPAMLRVILNGKRVGPVGNIPLYGEAVHQRPCNAILHSGKDIIIIKRDFHLYSDVKNCLQSDDTTYRQATGFHGEPAGPWNKSGNVVLEGHDIYLAPAAITALSSD